AILPASWVLMGRAYSGDDPQALAAFAERAGSSNVAVFVFVGSRHVQLAFGPALGRGDGPSAGAASRNAGGRVRHARLPPRPSLRPGRRDAPSDGPYLRQQSPGSTNFLRHLPTRRFGDPVTRHRRARDPRALR